MPPSRSAIGSTSFVPTAEYWTSLARELPRHPVAELRAKSDARQNAFRASDLPPPQPVAVELLDRVAADGWIVKQIRHYCPNCELELPKKPTRELVCPECEQEFAHHGGVVESVVYVRDVATRQVDWVVAVHGMNTRGEWQEEFSWYFSTTWGRAVPVSIYKYGIVIAGVLMPWRRRGLQAELRARFAALRDQAEAQGYSGKPDVIAHSFGTWLVGHMLWDEQKRDRAERLQIGRVVLAGSILRPDFCWQQLKTAEIVEEVLCHYGTRDPIVPLAHYTIRDSGPSGRRGFDGDEVINIMAEGYGHSDLFSVDKCIVAGEHLRKCTGADGEIRHLDNTYRRVWRPFLQLPSHELATLPDRRNPSAPWRPAPWWLQGTILPIFALPLVFLLLSLVVGFAGGLLWKVAPWLGAAAIVCLAALVLLSLGILSTMALRRRGKPRG